jgi:hypothetical protein
MVELRSFNLNLENPMTEDRLPLAELLAKSGEGDFLRSVAEVVLQMLMEADVEGLIGAGRYERQGDRSTYRNGYRDRALDTRLGSLQLRMAVTMDSGPLVLTNFGPPPGDGQAEPPRGAALPVSGPFSPSCS